MTPPNLTTNTPIADILHPIKVNTLPTLRLNGDFTLTHCFNCRLRKRLHLHKPLLGETAIYNSVATVTVADLILVGFHLNEVTTLFQVCHDGLTALKAIHAFVTRKGIHRAIVIHNIDLRQIVTLPHGKVVRI
jgi:hypothetical protein